MGIGIVLSSIDDANKKIIADPVELAKYLSITSLTATTEAGTTDSEYTLVKPLISCKDIFDEEKFKNLKV